MVRSMAKDPIIFACANPTPEIFPEAAKAAGAAVVSTGRSDYPNQVNNVLCFPGIFRGALDVRASDINEEMKIAAAYAIAGLVSEEELCADYILPKAFDPSKGCRCRGSGGSGAKKQRCETGIIEKREEDGISHLLCSGDRKINIQDKPCRRVCLAPGGIFRCHASEGSCRRQIL